MPTDGLIGIEDLAKSVNEWCVEHGIEPANGQAGALITERNIRFYRTRGLLDPPGSGDGGHKRGFSPKHVAQLRAIRLLQANGVALDQIRVLLAERTLEQLRELESNELELRRGRAQALFFAGGSAETWQLWPIGNEFVLIARRQRTPTAEQRRQVAAVLGVR